MEVAECGAASLGIMLAYYGKIVPLAELRTRCGVSRDGSNAATLVRAARTYDLEADGYSVDLEDLEDDFEVPFVVFWDFNHFLVVEGFTRDKVLLNDPAVGHRRVTREEFDKSFTGVAVEMTPGENFQKGGQKPSMVSALRSRLQGFHKALVFAVLAGFLLVIPGLVIPAFSQVFLDQILIQGRGEWLKPLLVAMGVAVTAHLLLKFLQLLCLRRLRLALSARMSSIFFRHCLKLPAGFYAQRYAGEIATRTAMNDSVAGILSGRLAQTAIDVVMMVFYAAMMFFYDVSLTSIGIVFALVNFVVLRKISHWRVEANMRVLQEYGKVQGASIAGLQSMETIKASGMESGFFYRWAGYYANGLNSRQGLQLTNTALAQLPPLLSGLTTMLILALGGWYVIDGQLTIGMLVAFQILMTHFQAPVANLVDLGQTMQDLQGDLSRLDDVLAHEVDPGEDRPLLGADAGEGEPKLRLSGQLEVKNLTFGYNPTKPPLLENFSMTLKPGQRIALVGGSGSGKSTIAKLVTGLYQAWEGDILFDGVRREELSQGLLANSLSMVDQEVMMFGGTLRQNLTLWDETIPESTLLQACHDAEIVDRVHAFPGGLEGELSEGGGNLSGGERQRLEIARSLVCNPSILVLDEATSALDTESERLIVERIALRGCSCLIVAHRLSTIRDCDEIIVLDQGKVLERGTHEELWQAGGAYAKLLRVDEGAMLEGAS